MQRSINVILTEKSHWYWRMYLVSEINGYATSSNMNVNVPFVGPDREPLPGSTPQVSGQNYQPQRWSGQNRIPHKNVQLPRSKRIPRPKLVDGEWTIVYFGPYAYLRIGATGGDSERGRKIPRSKYLGKVIGQAIYKQPPEIVETVKERVLSAIERGQLDTIKAEIQQELRLNGRL